MLNDNFLTTGNQEAMRGIERETGMYVFRNFTKFWWRNSTADLQPQ